MSRGMNKGEEASIAMKVLCLKEIYSELHQPTMVSMPTLRGVEMGVGLYQKVISVLERGCSVQHHSKLEIIPFLVPLSAHLTVFSIRLPSLKDNSEAREKKHVAYEQKL